MCWSEQLHRFGVREQCLTLRPILVLSRRKRLIHGGQRTVLAILLAPRAARAISSSRTAPADTSQTCRLPRSSRPGNNSSTCRYRPQSPRPHRSPPCSCRAEIPGSPRDRTAFQCKMARYCTSLSKASMEKTQKFVWQKINNIEICTTDQKAHRSHSNILNRSVSMCEAPHIL
jgi:hypothetical protein